LILLADVKKEELEMSMHALFSTDAQPFFSVRARPLHGGV